MFSHVVRPSNQHWDTSVDGIIVYSPLFVPPVPVPGDTTTARYVGGGGGGGVLWLPLSFGEVTFSPPSSLDWLVSVLLDCSS